MAENLDGAVIAVAGAGGAAGGAVVRRLAAEGAYVVAAGRGAEALQALADDVVRAGGQASAEAVELDDEAAVRDWADRLATEHGHVDGLVHLVGGWSGSPSFAATDLTAAESLHEVVAGTLARTAIAFSDLLASSGRGRFVMVSAPAASHPTGGAAGYAAAKAAAEAWTLALADDFSARQQGQAGAHTGAAAVILVIKALVTPSMRAEHPERSYVGFTDPEDLAAEVAALWAEPAAALNGSRRWLTDRVD